MISSFGGEITAAKGFKLDASYLYVYENKSPTPFTSGAAPNTKTFDVNLPSRFAYNSAVKGGFQFDGLRRMTYGTDFTYDLFNKSSLFSFDCNYFPGRREVTAKGGVWTINAGVDFFGSSTGKGYIGQYDGNDRIRGGLAYAF